MPTADLVTAKVRPHVRRRAKRFARQHNATDTAVYSAAMNEFETIDPRRQCEAIERVHRAEGVRHRRVGRGNRKVRPAPTQQ